LWEPYNFDVTPVPGMDEFAALTPYFWLFIVSSLKRASWVFKWCKNLHIRDYGDVRIINGMYI
jgi:hypothetical protein